MRNDDHDDAIHPAAEPVSGNFRKFPVSTDRLNEPPADVEAKQRVAIELLAIGKSYVAVAKACDVTARTVYNWRQDRSFAARLSQRQQEMWSEAAARLRAMVHPSLDVLERHLFDPYDRARFRAATAVLRLADLRKIVPPAEHE